MPFSHCILMSSLQRLWTRRSYRVWAGYSDDLDRIAYSSLTREGHIVFDGGGNQAYGYRFGNRTIYPESPNSARSAFNKLYQTMNSYLANSTNLPVAHRWTGIIGMSLNRKPLIGISADVYFRREHPRTWGHVIHLSLVDSWSWLWGARYDPPLCQGSYTPIPSEPFRWLEYQLFTRLTDRSPRL